MKRVRSAFDGDDWLFEIKHDGFRVLAIRDEGSTRLLTRNGYDISGRHQHLIEALAGLSASRFVLDGELVALDDDGRSDFNKLMFSRTGSHYFAFDLLVLDSMDLRGSPLDFRKEQLRVLLTGDLDSIRYSITSRVEAETPSSWYARRDWKERSQSADALHTSGV